MFIKNNNNNNISVLLNTVFLSEYIGIREKREFSFQKFFFHIFKHLLTIFTVFYISVSFHFLSFRDDF